MKIDYNKFVSIVIFFSFTNSSFSQINENSNELSLPTRKIINELITFNKENSSFENKIKYRIDFNNVINSGHVNLDNNAELYSPSKTSTMVSARFSYFSQFITIEIEPYVINRLKYFKTSELSGPFQVSNNHTNFLPKEQNKIGLKQSQILLNIKNLQLGYGNMSHWWGSGFHTALTLTSNSPSQKTYFAKTKNSFLNERIAILSQIIAIPYRNRERNDIYFTGLRANIDYYSSLSIISIGFNRTYYSGNFTDQENINKQKWTLVDATNLVFEPLFGQSKRGLDYTIPGTPGFDLWDEMLSGFINLKFIDMNLEIYAEIASDDNRGNFTDLRAHWDHTLGYQLGIKKFTKINNLKMFTGLEYLSTKVSNTFNPKFYRGDPNSPNFYTKIIYDYSSYDGRRMGAHSGTSSDDLILLIGFEKNESILLASFNKERHGLKSFNFPEIKYELSIIYQYMFKNKYQFSLNLEHEKINNFGFKENNISTSKILWLGYSFIIK